MSCRQCGAPLSSDEMGLHRKLINRGDTTYLCKKCLAELFRVSTELLDEKIEQFRLQGCTLFVSKEKKKPEEETPEDGETKPGS